VNINLNKLLEEFAWIKQRIDAKKGGTGSWHWTRAFGVTRRRIEQLQLGILVNCIKCYHPDSRQYSCTVRIQKERDTQSTIWSSANARKWTLTDGRKTVGSLKFKVVSSKIIHFKQFTHIKNTTSSVLW
jgi:hypothetical protein